MTVTGGVYLMAALIIVTCVVVGIVAAILYFKFEDF